MAQDSKDNKIVSEGAEARVKILEGAKAVYDTVMTTYGPKGQNVLVEKVFGRPMPTRDGVSVARETYFKDRAKNMGSQLVLEASETTNRVAGDGSSATVGLAYHLIKNGQQLIASGVNPMEVKEILINDSEVLLDQLDKLSTPVKKSQLKEVATVSSGDPLLGELISGAINHVGENGGIMTEKSPISDVEREYVDGYYLQQGFTALPAGKKELIDPYVLVIEKRITSGADIAELLTKTLQVKNHDQNSIPRFLIIGNIEEAAYFNVVNLINQQKLDAVVIKTPPQFGEMGRELLADIAIYANCKVFTEGDSLKNFSTQITGPQGKLIGHSQFIGSINKVVATHTESTIFADKDSEAVKVRIQEIKDRLDAEISDAVAERLRDRIAKLEGKIALFRIGGATDSEKEEKEFRVEDSINATRAAQKHGVVPGGGITLLELSKLRSTENISDSGKSVVYKTKDAIHPIYRDALRSVFKKLLRNAALPAEVKLQEALNAPYGHGFNLRKDDKLVDLVEQGVLDPTLVVKEVIKNATSVAHIALTTGVLITFEDREEK